MLDGHIPVIYALFVPYDLNKVQKTTKLSRILTSCNFSVGVTNDDRLVLRPNLLHGGPLGLQAVGRERQVSQLAEDDLHQAVVQPLAELRGVGKPVEVQHDDFVRGEFGEFPHLLQHGQELDDLDEIVVYKETGGKNGKFCKS